MVPRNSWVSKKIWPNLKILEAVRIGLQISFSGDFASQSLELHTGKEIILDGPAATDEIQTKNKKYDTQRKHMFLSQRKTKWPWLEYDEEKGKVLRNVSQKISIVSRQVLRLVHIANVYWARANSQALG